MTTTSIREQFDKDGYVIVRNVLDADLVGEASRHVERLIPGKHLPFRGCEQWR